MKKDGGTTATPDAILYEGVSPVEIHAGKIDGVRGLLEECKVGGNAQVIASSESTPATYGSRNIVPKVPGTLRSEIDHASQVLDALAEADFITRIDSDRFSAELPEQVASRIYGPGYSGVAIRGVVTDGGGYRVSIVDKRVGLDDDGRLRQRGPSLGYTNIAVSSTDTIEITSTGHSGSLEEDRCIWSTKQQVATPIS
jgi:hypothetical protein